jgi:hypothetical protein
MNYENAPDGPSILAPEPEDRGLIFLHFLPGVRPFQHFRVRRKRIYKIKVRKNLGIIVKATLFLVLLGLLFLSSSSQAGWQTIWDTPIGTAVVVHNQVADTTEVFATNKDTGDIYRYKGNVNDWEKVGNPGSMFVSTGENLVGITPAGNEVWMYTGSGTQWNIIGDEFRTVYGGGGKLYAMPLNNNNLNEYKGGIGSSNWRWDQISDASGIDMPTTLNYVVAANNLGTAKLFRLSNNRIFEYISPNTWREPFGITPPIYEMAAGGNYLWASDTAGAIWEFKWNEPSQECVGGPSGTTCHFVLKKIRQFDTTPKALVVDVVGKGGGRPGLYALSRDGSQLWKYSGTPEQWDEIPLPRGSSVNEIYAGGGMLLAKMANSNFREYTSSQASMPSQASDLGGDTPVSIRSQEMRGYQVFLDGSYIGTEGAGGDVPDGVFDFKVVGGTSHNIKVYDGQFDYPKSMYFERGVLKIIYVEPVGYI